MKLEELKCKNCGAIMEAKEGAKTITCKYCHTTFNIKEDNFEGVSRKQGYEFEKGRLEAQQEQFKENLENIGEYQEAAKKMLNGISPVFKIFPIIFGIVFVVILGVIIFVTINIASGFKESREESQRIKNEQSKYENMMEKGFEKVMNNF